MPCIIGPALSKYRSYMQVSELDFSYPADLVATEPSRPSRVLFSSPSEPPLEVGIDFLIERIPEGDLLVINDTKVLPVRVWSTKADEVLFVRRNTDHEWEVLFLARDHNIGDKLEFPGDLTASLVSKGLPQTLQFDRQVSRGYFEKHGEPALPPYIQAARGERYARPSDFAWYQTAWAQHPGSSAAPTASLHFSNDHLSRLRARGVRIAPVTLHVGLGTFLPMKGERFEDHKMHAEDVFISHEATNSLEQTRKEGGKVWALGTTVCRSLEAWARGDLKTVRGGHSGATDLFITPGFQFKVVDRLLTNFHQPRSTLLALVMAFAGKRKNSRRLPFCR